MPFRDRVARRFGETVSSPASLSPFFHPAPLNNSSPDPRISTGSGLGLGCNRNRATARLDRRDDTSRSDSGSNSSRSSGEGEKIARSVLGPQHPPNNKVLKGGKPRTRWGGRRRAPATTGRSTSPITRRRSRRSSSASSSTSIISSTRSFHSRVTRASSRLTDENGEQLSPTAPYLSCKFIKTRPLPPRSSRHCIYCMTIY